MTMLQKIVGERLKTITESSYDVHAIKDSHDLSSEKPKRHGFFLFEFGEYSLSIYNPVKIFDRSGSELTLFHLKDLTVRDVAETPQEIVITFAGDIVLRVDMREECYSGPEAMYLRGPHDLHVVWQ